MNWPVLLLVVTLALSGGVTGWTVTDLTYKWVTRPHTVQTIQAPPRITRAGLGGYTGGRRPGGEPPIPPLFDPGWIQQTVDNVTVTKPRIPPGHTAIETWGGDIISVLRDNFRGIKMVNGQAMVFDGSGHALDIAGRVYPVLQTDQKMTDSQCDDLIRAWQQATCD